jgi:hypothetical protein
MGDGVVSQASEHNHRGEDSHTMTGEFLQIPHTDILKMAGMEASLARQIPVLCTVYIINNLDFAAE